MMNNIFLMSLKDVQAKEMWNEARTATVVLVAFWFTSERDITHPLAIHVIAGIPID